MAYDIAQSFMSGYQVPEKMAESDVNLQRAQLQKQYLPESMQNLQQQERDLTETKNLQLQQLKQTVAGEAQAAPAINAYLSNPATQGQPLSVIQRGLAPIYFAANNPKAGMKALEDATKSEREETQTKESQGKIVQGIYANTQAIAKNIDPTDSKSWEDGIFAIRAAGGDPTRMVKEAQAGGDTPESREKALREGIKRVQTSEQLKMEQKANEDKQRADKAAADAARADKKLNAFLTSTTARANSKDAADTRKERNQKLGYTSSMNKKIESLREKYQTTLRSESDDEKRLALTEEYNNDRNQVISDTQDIFNSAGYEFNPPKELTAIVPPKKESPGIFERLGITSKKETPKPSEAGSAPKQDQNGIKAMVERSGGEAPPYGSWAASARSLNPGVSPEELKSAYEKRYGSKTQGSSSSPTPKQMPPDLRKEYGDINMRLSLPGISDTKKLELLLRKKEIEKSLNKPWKKYD